MMEKFIKTPFAFLGDRAEIPDPVQSSGDVSMMNGYGYDYERDQLTDASAKNIERQKMNWLFYVITRAISEYQSSGAPEFITTEMNGGSPYSYQKSALVRYNQGIYYSLVNDNTATPEDNTKWAQLMYASEDIFDGYLRIDKLLAEIAKQGAEAQKEARKNIGIDGDIAFRDKENIFKEINTFNKLTQFNDDVTVAAGKKISAPTIYLTYNGEKMGELSASPGKLTSLNSDGELALGGATVHDLIYSAGGSKYEVWHEGNYDPVRTVNYVGPDQEGNVDVQVYPVPSCDGAFAQVVINFPKVKDGGTWHFNPILMTDVIPASDCSLAAKVNYGSIYLHDQISVSGVLAGCWRTCVNAYCDVTTDEVSLETLAQRIPIGNIKKFSNITNPQPKYITPHNTPVVEYDYINLTCDIEGVGAGVIFTARGDDPEEYGRQLFANAVAGMYGELPHQ
ncbi:hypothetical protein KEH73_004902 [Salmonella enterica]|nr:hypothetical protein [Salmonella enterica]HBJ6598217.1 hypothetical protein [Salmonella enterica subsp. enterica serovar Havana]EHL7670636.1 hypothetical protein [Salmonella enterica]EHM8725100.1 hypothetical protein [Salmonella enterica]EHM8726995.1 hypothetical protein [Salmonella enterica]